MWPTQKNVENIKITKHLSKHSKQPTKQFKLTKLRCSSAIIITKTTKPISTIITIDKQALLKLLALRRNILPKQEQTNGIKKRIKENNRGPIKFLKLIIDKILSKPAITVLK